MTDSSTPAQLGFRWPAEWEPHAGTWLTWPHNPDTWPGQLTAARGAFASIVRALHEGETVNLLVGDEALEEDARATLGERGVDLARLRFHRIATDDGWLRDCGPVFLVDDAGGRLAIDFGFDAWGGKYPPWERDAETGAAVAEAAGIACLTCPTVIEGGALEGDGHGTVLTTGRCLLDPARGPGRTRAVMERLLGDQLAARRVIWLEGEIEGDDTDGHVDQLARFVAPGRVVAVPQEATLGPLRAAGLEVVELPAPPLVRVEGEVVPASYANFYLANGVVLVPTFGVPEDARALALLGELLPDRRAVAIPSRELAVGLGALHCVTQQEPEAPKGSVR